MLSSPVLCLIVDIHTKRLLQSVLQTLDNSHRQAQGGTPRFCQRLEIEERIRRYTRTGLLNLMGQQEIQESVVGVTDRGAERLGQRPSPDQRGEPIGGVWCCHSCVQRKNTHGIGDEAQTM